MGTSLTPALFVPAPLFPRTVPTKSAGSPGVQLGNQREGTIKPWGVNYLALGKNN